MPYEDHLQKQIDRFAQALATLLKNIASGTYEHASTESAINEVLQEHGQSDLSKLLKFDFEELVMWFTKPPFNKENRDLIIQLLFELDQQQSSIELNALLIDLIRIADSESDAVSLERLNMMKVLAKE